MTAIQEARLKSEWSRRAKKLGNASDATRRTLSTPMLTVRLAWIHCMSEIERFVMFPSPVLKRSSNLSRALWPWHGERRSVCMIFGALKEDFKRVSSSWAGSRLSLSMALSRSAHRASRTSLSAGPSISGAPKRVAFSFDVITMSRKADSVLVEQRWMTSHFLVLRYKPRVLPSVRS